MADIEMRQDIGGWKRRWNNELAQKSVASGEWPNRTVADFARELAQNQPERLILVDEQQAFSAAQLYKLASALAGYFVAIGLHRGEVISFQLPNWWEATVINLAAAMTGVVVNPIVPINRDAEVTHMLNASRSRVMFIPHTFRNYDYAAMLQRISPNLTTPPKQVLVRGLADGFENLEDLLQTASPIDAPLEVDPDAVKLLMYTSGTTGRPKGVLHSHNTIHADSVKMKAAIGLDSNDVIFCPSPLTHISGYLWVLNMPWLGNIPAVTVDQWNPGHAYELMQKHRCSFMTGATPFLQDLVTIAKEADKTLVDLRSYMCGGAAVPPSLIYEAAEVFPNCIPWRTFGSTEAPTLTAPPGSRQDIRLGAETDGRLCGVQAKVLDAMNDAPVAAGEEGELLVMEPSMALGYAREEDNKGSYDDEGYFRMGDLVKLVEGGHVICTGRKKDIIIRSGENISAKEIEDVLHRSADVQEAAVVAMPSKKTGDAICAFIVPRGKAHIDLDQVSEMIAKAGLAKQKTPEHIELVDELPKNPAGKVRKDILREMAKGAAVN